VDIILSDNLRHYFSQSRVTAGGAALYLFQISREPVSTHFSSEYSIKYHVLVQCRLANGWTVLG